MKQYTLDFSHSIIGFSMRHMMILRILGTFESYSATLVLAYLENMHDAHIVFSIIVTSISTTYFNWEVHLVSPIFGMMIFSLKLRLSLLKLKK